MGGGLLNLMAHGAENLIINGNPKTTYFKTVYKTHTNFGIQKFRVDYNGQRMLDLNKETELTFKIPRYADLVNDVYLVMNLPDIWSGVYVDSSGTTSYKIPYEFKWIEEIGVQMISEITIMHGGLVLSKYSGEYLSCLVERDLNGTKKELWNRMVGNLKELNDPANASTNYYKEYPNAFYDTDVTTPGPSILGKTLYIPIMPWFGMNSKQSFPLVASQYNELFINIKIKPVRELYIIRDVENYYKVSIASEIDLPEYIAPNTTNDLHQLYRFLNPPINTGQMTRNSTRNDWNADIHLLCNYVFLSDEEQTKMAGNEQKYIARLPYERDYHNVTGSRTIDIECRDLVSSLMWRFRRSDVNEINAWNNYTNWIGNYPPDFFSTNDFPIVAPPGTFKGRQTANANPANQKEIMLDCAISFDGKYRENTLDAGVYNLTEKLYKTPSNAKDGLYCYNFCMNTDHTDPTPSGAVNLAKFEHVTLEFNTIQPPINGAKQFDVLCDEDGNVIGYRKDAFNINEYNFDLRVFEERYNVVYFRSGHVGLVYAK
uniref:Major capsid protein N-terminal domain-containing protein n=1 Tax=viral metagenome TaxID=1070528 RepID=A0A6C0BVJ4_9ZZZZ